MGSFSWLCCECDKQILSEGESWSCFKCEEDYEGKQPVVLMIPSKWNSGQLISDWFYEDDYEGYGEFGGMDAYSLVARMNDPMNCPSGIMLTPTGKLRSGLSFMAALLDVVDEEAMDADRHYGISLVFGGVKLDYPIKIAHYGCAEAYGVTYENAQESSDDPNQGWVHNKHDEGSISLCSDCWGG